MRRAMSDLTIHSTIKLASGYEMPVLGYGVYRVPAADVPRLLTCALSLGYRHVDSATAYRNESACAQTIEKASTEGVPASQSAASAIHGHQQSPHTHNLLIPRSEIFFTTKLPPKFRGYKATRESIDKTIEGNPGLRGYLDLFLIHAPYGGRENRIDSWRAMRDAWQEGKVRSLGVSNFSIKHMEEIQEWIQEEEKRTGKRGAGGILSVGQWEVHPWCPRHDILAYCQTHNITPQAYSPLVRGNRFAPPPTAENPKPTIPEGSEYLYQLVEKYQRTPAQILLRWSLQMGCVPLPKSVHEERIKENAGIFGWELEQDEVERLDTGKHEPVAWDPVTDCKD